MADEAQTGFCNLLSDPRVLLSVAAGIRQAFAPLQQHLAQGFAQTGNLHLALGAQVFLLQLLDLGLKTVVSLAGLFQGLGHFLEFFPEDGVVPGQGLEGGILLRHFQLRSIFAAADLLGLFLAPLIDEVFERIDSSRQAISILSGQVQLGTQQFQARRLGQYLLFQHIRFGFQRLHHGLVTPPLGLCCWI